MTKGAHCIKFQSRRKDFYWKISDLVTYCGVRYLLFLKTKNIRTALVIGGGSGMGRSAAVALDRMGIQVFVADLDVASARETVSNTPAPRNRGEAFHVNVSQSDSVGDLFQALKNDCRFIMGR